MNSPSAFNACFDPAYINNFKRLLAIFIARTDLFTTFSEITNEVSMITNNIPVDVLFTNRGGRFENIAYIKMSRVGANVPLNRSDRVTIASLINRALEHAYVETYGIN